MDEQVTNEICPCKECLVSTTCTIIEDCEKWFSFFVTIVDKLPDDLSGNETNLEGVNTDNMKTLRDLIDKMLSAESTLTDLENNFGDLEGRLSQIERNDPDIESMLKDVVEEHFSNTLQDFENRLEDSEHEIEELKNLDERVSHVENAIEESDIQKIDDIESRVSDIEYKLDDVETDVSDVKNNNYDIEDLRTKIDNEIVKDIVALKQSQKSVVEINGQFADLNTRIGDLEYLINSNLPQGQLK